MIKMSRQKAITAFFWEKYGDHVQHNQCTSSESVNLAASAEPVDLDEDYSIQTADAEPTFAKTDESLLKTIKVIALLNFNVNLLFDLAAHLLWVIRMTFINLTL